MGHKLPVEFFKQATTLPTYLCLKPVQDGLSQLSCFFVFFAVGLTQRDSIYQQLSCGRTSSTGGCTHARCWHVRTTSTCARSHPRKLPGLDSRLSYCGQSARARHDSQKPTAEVAELLVIKISRPFTAGWAGNGVGNQK